MRDDLGIFLDQSGEPLWGIGGQGRVVMRPRSPFVVGKLSGRLAVDELGALWVNWAVGD